MRENLVRALRDAGQEIHELEGGDGSTMLVLPHGGRILGLFGPRSGENFLWTSPALSAADSARSLFESDAWHNTGGDRTWLAPEVDFFLPEYPKLEKYLQPRGLDPGRYAVEALPGGLRMENVLRATLSRSKVEVSVRIAKEIGPAPNPLRHERGLPLCGDLEYAGYTLRTTAELVERPGTGVWVGVWSLLQLPHGGDLMVPTYGPTAPRIYFGTVSRDDLVVKERMVLWRMRAAGEHKIGIRAVATTGRAGYLYPTGGRWSLVIRNFSVDPSCEYVDVPWTEPGDFGYALQACNVKSALGSFSELEHHSPAASGDSRRPAEDVSQVWAFRGSLDAVRQAASCLLAPIA